MKKWFIIASFILIILVAALGNLTAAAPAGIVYPEGIHFYVDGKPFYFAGCNSYDLFTYGDGYNDSTPDYIENYFMNKSGIDTIMSQMADDGVNVVRTWGFSHEKWHGFEPEEGVYNEAEFMLFDYIMESARKHGIKIIITLENYWEAYGGIDKRLAWEGLPGSSHANRAQFFTNKGCKEQYRNYVKYFVTRVNHYTNLPYKDDPTLFAWELMNEPRYQDAGENSTGKTLRAWVDEMGAYIKSLDPNHMVGVGIEGHESKYGFGGDEGNPFVYLQQSESVDFCTAHPYPDETWANLSVAQTRKLVEAWIKDAHELVGKPFILEEWNVHSNKDSYWPAMLDEIEHHDAAGSLFWNYNDYRTSDFDMLKGDAILGTIFKPHAAKMAAKCGTTVTPTPSKTPVFTPTPSKTPVITPSPSQTPSIPPTPSPTTGQGYAVKYVVNDWGGGATVNFTIKNTGTAVVNGWQVSWTFPGDQKITNLWNGSYTQKDSKVIVDNLPYNGTIAPGGAVNFGFNLGYSGSNIFPGKFTVNGVNCIPEN